MPTSTRSCSACALEYPATNATHLGTAIVEWRRALATTQRPLLLLLQAAVALVLVVACANVANLLLAAAVRREHEFAVRAAIGGSRSRLVRQLSFEALIIAAAAALGAIAIQRADGAIALGARASRPSGHRRVRSLGTAHPGVHADGRAAGHPDLRRRAGPAARHDEWHAPRGTNVRAVDTPRPQRARDRRGRGCVDAGDHCGPAVAELREAAVGRDRVPGGRPAHGATLAAEKPLPRSRGLRALHRRPAPAAARAAWRRGRRGRQRRPAERLSRDDRRLAGGSSGARSRPPPAGAVPG